MNLVADEALRFFRYDRGLNELMNIAEAHGVSSTPLRIFSISLLDYLQPRNVSTWVLGREFQRSEHQTEDLYLYLLRNYVVVAKRSVSSQGIMPAGRCSPDTYP